MPLPEPENYDNEDEFIQACMSDSVVRTEFKDEGQRRAVCQSIWDRRNSE